MNLKNAFQTIVGIRFRDLDVMGHVKSDVFFTYFEEGRKALYHDVFRETVPGGFNFTVAKLDCDYLIPVRLEDQILLKLWVTSLGTKSFGLAYELFDANEEGRIFAKGSSVQVCYDYRRYESIPIPDNLRKALSDYHPSP